MKVGLITGLGASRSPFWERLLRELGMELSLPSLPFEQVYELGRASLPNEPAHVQLLLGRVLELERSDLVLLPGLLPVAQDAWGEALGELLPRRLSGLPPMQTLPAGVPAPGETGDEAALLAAAAELGQRLTRNPARVRLALDRSRPLARPPRPTFPLMERAGRQTVAVLGQPALLADPDLSAPLRAHLEGLGLHPVFGTELPQEQVWERAGRFDPGEGAAPPAGQRWLNGVQGLLEGRSAVRGLLYVFPRRDLAWERALTRMTARARKPQRLLGLDPGSQDWSPLEGFGGELDSGGRAAQPPHAGLSHKEQA